MTIGELKNWLARCAPDMDGWQVELMIENDGPQWQFPMTSAAVVKARGQIVLIAEHETPKDNVVLLKPKNL